MGICINNTFAVSAPPDQAWKVLLDVAKIAPCVPGAELTEITDPTHFKGKARVKVGPVELAFTGQAEFVSVDSVNRTARLAAKGNDTKGRGAASATIDFQLTPEGEGSRVTATTDLNMTGAIAQYGRGVGVMNDVANHITSVFAQNLQTLLAQEPSESAPAVAATTQQPAKAAPISFLTLLRVILQGFFTRLFGGASGKAKS
jgi:carbon monoxide dehydrogenase subunit G